MAYFSNGTEGTDYEQRWCANCTHGADGGAGACPVWLLHLVYNGQTGNVGEMLDALIPRDQSRPGSPNAECALFVLDGRRAQGELPL